MDSKRETNWTQPEIYSEIEHKTVFQSSIAAMSFKDATNWLKEEHPDEQGFFKWTFIC